ncbi:MAG: fructosamine kinase family protein [Opitutales bacterium]
MAGTGNERWAAVARSLTEQTGEAFDLNSVEPAAGGSINQAVILHFRKQPPAFVKWQAGGDPMPYETEADALNAIHATDTIRVPAVYGQGSLDGGGCWLAIEWLDLGGRGDGGALGRALAALHRVEQTRFGWHRDNVIGATPQPNGWSDDWIAFYREQRLEHQFRLARKNGLRIRESDTLLETLPVFFESYTPQPSLLHGDLWGGNAGFLTDGTPVIYDPASYQGDREADLAFTEVFGGFPDSFQAAYREAWPLDDGYRYRKTLYNLYHILNHFNLFGGGYGSQAEGMVQELLRNH